MLRGQMFEIITFCQRIRTYLSQGKIRDRRCNYVAQKHTHGLILVPEFCDAVTYAAVMGLEIETGHRHQHYTSAEVQNTALVPQELIMAGGLGFEPRLTESESVVLPLNYPPPCAASVATPL